MFVIAVTEPIAATKAANATLRPEIANTRNAENAADWNQS